MKKQFLDEVEIGYSIEPKLASPRLIQQVHGPKIVERSDQIVEADGIFTQETGQPIHIFTADCIPLLFFSPDKNAPIIAVHSGWRGVLNRIALNAMELLSGCPVQVVIGPSILSCCFEVKEDLVEAFRAAGHSIKPYLIRRNDTIHFNLVEYVIDSQLQGATVHRDWNRCTVCSAPALPSFRRNKSTDPHIRSWIVKRASQ